MLGTTDVVLPVSDELNCRACHISDGSAAAQPLDGWVHDPDPERDTRLNILRLHDDRRGGASRCISRRWPPPATTPGAVRQRHCGRPADALCAAAICPRRCRAAAWPGISPLTQAVHRPHGVRARSADRRALDASRQSLGLLSLPSRLGHPLPARRHGRGGRRRRQRAPCSARAATARMHRRGRRPTAPAGSTSRVARAATPAPRCATTAQLRYTSAFEPDGSVRQARRSRPSPPTPIRRRRDSRSTASRPATAGCACEACHGATHAEYPSIAAQRQPAERAAAGTRRHAGRVRRLPRHGARAPSTADRTACIRSGQRGCSAHPDAAEEGGAQRCRACHGADYRGTVLSRAQGDRTTSKPTSAASTSGAASRSAATPATSARSGEQAQSEPRADRRRRASRDRAVDAPVRIALVAHDADGDTLMPAHRQPGAARHRRPDGCDRALHPRAGLQRRRQLHLHGVRRLDRRQPRHRRPSPSPALVRRRLRSQRRRRIDELVRGVSIALGMATVDDAPLSMRTTTARWRSMSSSPLLASPCAAARRADSADCFFCSAVLPATTDRTQR